MKLTVHLLIALLAALALAASASAKELKSAQVCGLGDQCAPLDDRNGANAITNFTSPSPPPPTAPYYRLEFVYGEPGSPDHNAFSHLFVLSKNLVAAGGETPGTIIWFPVSGAALDVIRDAVGDIRPYAAPAAWPKSIDDPIFTPTSNPKPAPVNDDGTNWTPWLVGAAAILLALAAGAFFARRMRVRRPRTVSP